MAGQLGRGVRRAVGRWLLGLVAAGLFGCGGGAGGGGGHDGGADVAVPDVPDAARGDSHQPLDGAGELPAPPDGHAAPDDGATRPDETPADLPRGDAAVPGDADAAGPDTPDTPPPPDVPPDVAGGDGDGGGAALAFGEACEHDAQCASGLCLPFGGGFACSAPCLDACPSPLWFCAAATASGGDSGSFCVPLGFGLCRPCRADADCGNAAFDLAYRCLDYGDDGSFCGRACLTGANDCPTGYVCAEGVDGAYCRLQAGQCPCSPDAMAAGATTDCARTNAFGSCGGERACSSTGLTACTAPDPAVEACDLVDNDCDGSTDEDTGDTDLDGDPDCTDPDDDNDTVLDDGDGSGVLGDLPCSPPELAENCDDNCPLVRNTDQADLDGDGLGNRCDGDRDNDGVPNEADPDADYPFLCGDSDDDACDDCALLGVSAPLFDGADEDNDGICDWTDDDNDNDGVSDAVEANCGSDPHSATSVPADLDGDGQCDLLDPDDDDDGWSDINEYSCGTSPRSAQDVPADLDDDGTCDRQDPDDDGDGVRDDVDPDTRDPHVCGDSDADLCDDCAVEGRLAPAHDGLDTDGDGRCNTGDGDDDGDGANDLRELACGSDPLNAQSAPPDRDGDGFCDGLDPDDDGDGWSDSDELSCGSDPMNTASMPVDEDDDGICDVLDQDGDGDGWVDQHEIACGSDPNDGGSIPADLDGDHLCDVMDPDPDGDNVLDDGNNSGTTGDAPCGGGQYQYCDDNCPRTDNPNQADGDGDGLGDLCDDDRDGDGWDDDDELLCGTLPADRNSVPGDVDGDGTCDVLDDDRDGDGILDDGDGSGDVSDAPCSGGQSVGCDDNCLSVVNPDQADLDGDRSGDACDSDDDGDGWLDADEVACGSDPRVGASTPPDADGDRLCNGVDSDADNDGIRDDGDESGTRGDAPCDDGVMLLCDDNCPLVINPAQGDLDRDTLGDACDPDIDNDGSLNAADCAPTNPAVSPTASESCDGVDNDCDSQTDEGSSICPGGQLCRGGSCILLPEPACRLATFQTGVYAFCELGTALGWETARGRCQAWGGQLLSVTSQAEQDFIAATLTGGDAYWLSANDREDEGDWRWADGSAVDDGYDHWCWGQPFGGDCGAGNRGDDGCWGACPCQYGGCGRGYVCEK